MRLSTEPDRDEARGIAVLHAAFDAGITLLDTADAYCRDDSDRGHNERLIARAIASWPGDRSRIHVATKGGITRPGGRWEPDGRAKHLIAAAHASRAALGVDRIHLYQLHAPDPNVPLATSVRALAALKRDGVIDQVGLSNITVSQIEEARRIVPIDAVQVEASIWQDAAFLNGVVDYCTAHGMQLLAYRPLGGRRLLERTGTHPVLAATADRLGATAFETALAWLMDQSPAITPIPGATRVETARSIARAATIVLSDDDRARLDEAFPAGRRVRSAASPRPHSPSTTDREVVIVMGMPGAGKSTIAAQMTAEGYVRLNRDERGGLLRDLLPLLDDALRSGAERVVLDNTYGTRQSRADVIQTAGAHGVPVRCVWLTTSLEDAQVNAVTRLIERYGRLPDADGIKPLRKRDPGAFPPSAQFRYQRALEPPDAAEGFSRIDAVPFIRSRDPSFTTRAVLVWCDGVILHSRSGRRIPLTADDVAVSGARTLKRYHDDGWRVLGLSWQAEIAEGAQTTEGATAVLDRMRQLLEVPIDVEYCPHPGGPPICWCRKPLPGLPALLQHRHRLDPAQCVYVGSGAQDPGFARRIGFAYVDADTFFADDRG